MEDMMQFIPSELLIVITATYIIGIFLKWIEGFKDKYITITLMVFAIVFSLGKMGLSVDSVLQGILCWGVSVGVNQTFKQLNKE